MAEASIITTLLRSMSTASWPTTLGTSSRSRPTAAPKATCPRSCTTEARPGAASSAGLTSSGASKILADSKICTPSFCSCSFELLTKNTKTARNQPTTTAAIRSTKTVIRKVVDITMTSDLGSPRTRLMRLQSTTSSPDFMRIPARQDRGMCLARGPSPSTAARSTTECVAPEIGVRPPVLTFTTVRMVAPAPACPPKRPATAFPMPWPTSSRSLSWKEEVMESATSEVSKESMAPSTASMRAVKNMSPSKAEHDCNDGSCSIGSPRGMAPRVGTVMPTRGSSSALAAEAPTSASSGRGTLKVKRSGSLYSMKRVRMPMPSAPGFGLTMAAGILARASRTLPPPAQPSSTGTCNEQMMPPIPDMKPDSTVLGTSRIPPPNFSTPRMICMTPAMATTPKVIVGSWYLATMLAMTTAMGPVGPVTCAGVPPKSAAKNPVKMAP
mmetsp:Transcript_82316/g.233158  ORF Transcript_82316/g.233158 Transcript_82316/m.233158 type:complete len:441 (-) Transcript_82316:200-1522(-)